MNDGASIERWLRPNSVRFHYYADIRRSEDMGSNKQYQDERDQVQAGNLSVSKSQRRHSGWKLYFVVYRVGQIPMSSPCNKYMKHKEKRVMKDSTQQSDSTVTDN